MNAPGNIHTMAIRMLARWLRSGFGTVQLLDEPLVTADLPGLVAPIPGCEFVSVIGSLADALADTAADAPADAPGACSGHVAEQLQLRVGHEELLVARIADQV